MICKARGNEPHCFCLMAVGVTTGEEDERVMRCCWCGETSVYVIVRTPIQGHGPRRFTVTYEPK